MLDQDRLVVVAEDIEHFRKWWERDEDVNSAAIRHGSAALRRLLVEDAAGTAWRQLGFEKSPKVQGPDLLGILQEPFC